MSPATEMRQPPFAPAPRQARAVAIETAPQEEQLSVAPTGAAAGCLVAPLWIPYSEATGASEVFPFEAVVRVPEPRED